MPTVPGTDLLSRAAPDAVQSLSSHLERVRHTTNWPVVAAAVAVVATPLLVTRATIFPFELGSALASRVLIELVLLTWLFAVLFKPGSVRVPTHIVLAVALFLAVALATSLLGVDPAHSFWSTYAREGGVWGALHWFALALVLASLGPDDRAWGALLTAYVVVAAMTAAFAVLEAHFAWPFVPPQGAVRVVSTIGNASQLGAFLAAALIITGGKIASCAPLRGGKILSVGILPLMVWALLLTGSRGPTVGVLCGLGVFAFLPRGSRGTRMIAGVLVTTIASVGLWSLIAPSGGVLGARGLWRFTGLSERLELWRIAWHGLRDHLAMGWGSGNYARVFDLYAGSPAPSGGWTNIDSPHNAIVEVAVDAGMLGVFALLVMVFAVSRSIVHIHRSEGQRRMLAAVVGALAATAVHAMFAPHSGTTSLTIALLVGWLAAYDWTYAQARPGPTTGAVTVVRCMVLAACVGVIGLAAVRVHAPTYRAAAGAFRALGSPVGTPRWHVAAEGSIASYVPRSPYLRRLMFGQVSGELDALSGARLTAARSFVREHGFESIDTYPDDGRLAHAVLGVLQAEATSAEELDRLEPYLARLARTAPARAGTFQLLAIQALRRGKCREAQLIISDYTNRIPEAAPAFNDITRVIESLGPSRCLDGGL